MNFNEHTVEALCLEFGVRILNKLADNYEQQQHTAPEIIKHLRQLATDLHAEAEVENLLHELKIKTQKEK